MKETAGALLAFLLALVCLWGCGREEGPARKETPGAEKASEIAEESFRIAEESQRIPLEETGYFPPLEEVFLEGGGFREMEGKYCFCSGNSVRKNMDLERRHTACWNS